MEILFSLEGKIEKEGKLTNFEEKIEKIRGEI